MAEYTNVFRLADMKMCTVAFENIPYEELNFDLAATKTNNHEGGGIFGVKEGDDAESPHQETVLSSSVMDEATMTQFGKT